MKTEKLTMILITLIFTIALAFGWIYFKDYLSPQALAFGSVFSVLHVLIFLLSIVKGNDPDYDWSRKVSILLAVVAIIVVMASGSQNKVEQEERAVKTEQTA